MGCMHRRSGTAVGLISKIPVDGIVERSEQLLVGRKRLPNVNVPMLSLQNLPRMSKNTIDDLF